jgi:hypothetical protein
LAEELPRLQHVLDAVGNRLGGPHDAGVLDYFYSDDYPFESDAVAKHLTGEETAVRLLALADAIESLHAYTPETIESALRDLATSRAVKAGEFIHPARVALTGRAASPGIFDVLYLIGKPKSVERLRRGAAIIRHDRELPRTTAKDGAASPGASPPPPPPGSEPSADVELASDWGDERPSDDA